MMPNLPPPNAALIVTGGCGFIGSALVRYLIKYTRYQVINIDRLTYAGDPATTMEVAHSSRYRFVKADIQDRQTLNETLSSFSPHAIIHLAAESHVDRSIHGPAPFIDTNIVGTYTLLETVHDWLTKAPLDIARTFRFIHVSTDEVFGDLPHPDEVPADKPLPRFDETSCYRPSSPYSASKAAADHLVRAWIRTYDFPAIVTNCSNNYGPWQYPEKFIPTVITHALEERPIPLYGKGNQIRDWLYVEDHVRALVHVMERGELGETYLIGGNNERPNLNVAQIICTLLDDLRPRQRGSHSDLITFVPDRPGHDRRYAIDNDKIRRELDWRPQENFDSGLKKTIEWYLRNQSWWQTKRAQQEKATR